MMPDTCTAAVVITALPDGTFSVLDAEGVVHVAPSTAALGRLCSRLTGASQSPRQTAVEEVESEEAEIEDPRVVVAMFAGSVAAAAAQAGASKLRELKEKRAAERVVLAEQARLRRKAQYEAKLQTLNAAERRRAQAPREPEPAPRISSIRSRRV